MRGKFISLKEACNMLDISESTIHRWKGIKMPFYKMGRDIKFKVSDIEEFREKSLIKVQLEKAELIW